MTEKSDHHSLLQKLKKRANTLKRDLFALYLAYKDPRTPWHAKIFSRLVVAYAFSPIDLIPDFIPILGYLDDLVLVPLGISIALTMIPLEVMTECRQRAQEEMSTGKPVNRAAAAVIILIWVGLAIHCIRWIKEIINYIKLDNFTSFNFF